MGSPDGTPKVTRVFQEWPTLSEQNATVGAVRSVESLVPERRVRRNDDHKGGILPDPISKGESASAVPEAGGGDEANGPFYLRSEHLIDVATRLSDLLPVENTDSLEQWLCVRFFETADASDGTDDCEMQKVLPDQITLRTTSCVEFAEAFFGLPLDEDHRHFLVFRATRASARRTLWPLSKGSNQWPIQSFWQRFKELQEGKPAHQLFRYSKSQGRIEISTKRGTEGVDRFREVILTPDVRLNILDLAEWLGRREAWSWSPSDQDVVGRFLSRIWIEQAEHDLFDAPSQELLNNVKAVKS